MKTILCALATALFATSVAADSCAFGTWRADLNDIAQMMATQMGGPAEAKGGNVTMQLAPGGTVAIVTDGMRIAVTPPGVPTMEVTVTGAARGSMAFSGGSFTTVINDYSLSGSADVLGQRMTIPFDSRTGMFGSSSGSYSCSGNTLQFTPAAGSGNMARVWRRAG